MPDFGDRLKVAIESYASRSALSEDSGVSDRTLSRWLDEETPPKLKRSDTRQNFQNLCETLGVREEWLLEGEGEMWRKKDTTLATYSYLPEGLGAGDETLPVDHGDEMKVSEQLLRAELGRVPPPSKAYWTRVNGESMEPYLQDGSPILVERVEDGVEAAGRYALLIDEVGGVVKRCERVGSETLRVASDNPSFPTRIYTHQENEHYEDRDGNVLKIRVQGRVVYPRDTPHAMQEKAIHDIARALRQSQA